MSNLIQISLTAMLLLSGCGGGSSSYVGSNSVESSQTDTAQTNEDNFTQNNTVDTIITAQKNAFYLYSTSYTDNGVFNLQNVCEKLNGENKSPQYNWEGAPIGTVKFALVMDDEVAPCGSGDQACVHWGLYNIPAYNSQIPEDVNISSILGATQGISYNGSASYDGPCPSSVHLYTTTLYALTAQMPEIENGETLTRSQFEARYAPYIISKTTMVGHFAP